MLRITGLCAVNSPETQSRSSCCHCNVDWYGQIDWHPIKTNPKKIANRVSKSCNLLGLCSLVKNAEAFKKMFINTAVINLIWGEMNIFHQLLTLVKNVVLFCFVWDYYTTIVVSVFVLFCFVFMRCVHNFTLQFSSTTAFALGVHACFVMERFDSTPSMSDNGARKSILLVSKKPEATRMSRLDPQATGLDAWASRVKCPARFVSHLHDICIYMSCS